MDGAYSHVTEFFPSLALNSPERIEECPQCKKQKNLRGHPICFQCITGNLLNARKKEIERGNKDA